MFMYVDTNSSVRSWQILYVNYVLQYVNGNADTLSPKLVTIHQVLSAYMRYARTRSQMDRRNNGQNDGVKTYSTSLTGQWWTNKFSTLQKS